MLQFHYTNKKAYHAVVSQPTWVFKAAQPPLPREHPFGAYFTDLPIDTPKLALRLRIPKRKIEYFFAFEDAGDLHRITGGRGEHIFYSPVDYAVVEDRQGPHGDRIGAIEEKEQ